MFPSCIRGVLEIYFISCDTERSVTELVHTLWVMPSMPSLLFESVCEKWVGPAPSMKPALFGVSCARLHCCVRLLQLLSSTLTSLHLLPFRYMAQGESSDRQ